MQADHASTTRRALFAAATVFPVAAVASRAPTIKTGGHTLYPAETPSEESDWVGFISMLALLHPNGRETAVHAFKAGMKLGDLHTVMVQGPAPEDAPYVMFRRSGHLYSFGPRGAA